MIEALFFIQRSGLVFDPLPNSFRAQSWQIQLIFLLVAIRVIGQFPRVTHYPLAGARAAREVLLLFHFSKTYSTSLSLSMVVYPSFCNRSTHSSGTPRARYSSGVLSAGALAVDSGFICGKHDLIQC